MVEAGREAGWWNMVSTHFCDIIQSRIRVNAENKRLGTKHEVFHCRLPNRKRSLGKYVSIIHLQGLGMFIEPRFLVPPQGMVQAG